MGRARGRALWPVLALPAAAWLLLLLVAPLYVVLAIAFGTVDPIFRTPIPVWNPMDWSANQFGDVFSSIIGPDGYLGPVFVRTALYVGLASLACLLIGYPVAYYVARLSGRWRGVLLALLVAPFWISYMMRMLAWVNLLQTDGIVNRLLSFGGVFDVRVDWLTGMPLTVVLGLIYGYLPFMILPLYAGLDRIAGSMLEASRDLGASRFDTFRRVTLPMSRPAIAAGLLLVMLPMLGDYFTTDLLSASPTTSMLGNLINETVETPGQTGQAAAFLLILLVISIIPMVLYIRSSNRAESYRS